MTSLQETADLSTSAIAPFTIFSASDGDKSAAHLARFLNKFSEGETMSPLPIHVVGTPRFLEKISADVSPMMQFVVIPETIDFDAQAERDVVNGILRNAPHLIVAQRLGGMQPTLSPQILRTVYRSGESIVGTIDAADREGVFENIISALGIADEDISWLVGEDELRIRVIHDGACVSDDYRTWLFGQQGACAAKMA